MRRRKGRFVVYPSVCIYGCMFISYCVEYVCMHVSRNVLYLSSYACMYIYCICMYILNSFSVGMRL